MKISKSIYILLLKASIIILILVYFLKYHHLQNKIKYYDIKSIKENIEKIFLNLKDKPASSNDYLIKKEKENLLKFLSKYHRKKIDSVDTIYLFQNFRFGNQIIIINKIIFYCEIISCKKIILDKNYNWFIKNKIFDEKYKMTIEVGSIDKLNNSKTFNRIFR